MHTFVRKYFRTFVRKYFRTKVLSYVVLVLSYESTSVLHFSVHVHTVALLCEYHTMSLQCAALYTYFRKYSKSTKVLSYLSIILKHAQVQNTKEYLSTQTCQVQNTQEYLSTQTCQVQNTQEYESIYLLKTPNIRILIKFYLLKNTKVLVTKYSIYSLLKYL